MSVLILGIEMPKSCRECPFLYMTSICDGSKDCPLVHVPPHGRLIDADALRAKMYHEAFETDTPMQKWDSGCWIRYKMFEKMEEYAPTIIPAEEVIQ